MADSAAEAKVALARAIVELGSRGSHDWDNFMSALREYDREAQKLLVQSPIDQLQVIQGRAQASAQLLTIFEKCKTIAEPTTQQQKVKPNERRLGT